MPRSAVPTVRRPAMLAPAAAFAALAAVTATTPALAIDRYWVEPLIGNWADSPNWSSLPGGGGMTGIPLFGDAAWILTDFASDAPIVLFTADATPQLTEVTLGGPGAPHLSMGGGTLNHHVTRIGREGNGTVTVGGTSFLNATSQLALGIFDGDDGTLHIVSDGVAQSPLVAIGITGDGHVSQTGNGLLDAGEVIMARNPFSSGTWTIDVADDAAFVTADVEVGRDGSGVLDIASGLLEVGGTITFGSGAGKGGGTWSGGLVDAGAIELRESGFGSLDVDGAEVNTGDFSVGLDNGQALFRMSSGLVQCSTFATGTIDADLRMSGGVLTTGTALIGADASFRETARFRAQTSLTIDAFPLDQFIVADAAQVLTPSLILADGALRLDGGTIAGSYLPPPFDVYLIGDLESDGAIVFNGGDLFMNVTSRGDLTFGTGITEVTIAGRLVVEDGFLFVPEGVTLSVGRDATLQGSFFSGSLIVDGTFESLERITTVFGGQILGEGAILGGVDAGSRIVPASQLEVGRIRIGGGLTMGPESAIYVDIQDPDAGVNDVVEMLDASPVQLGGTLDFRVMAGWTPAPGDAVVAVEWPAGTPVTGDFAAIETFDEAIFPAGLTPVGTITATGYVLSFEQTCAGDVDGDGAVAFGDIVSVLAAWGTCTGDCPADLNGDGEVGFTDLVAVLAAFGTCG